MWRKLATAISLEKSEFARYQNICISKKWKLDRNIHTTIMQSSSLLQIVNPLQNLTLLSNKRQQEASEQCCGFVRLAEIACSSLSPRHVHIAHIDRSCMALIACAHVPGATLPNRLAWVRMPQCACPSAGHIFAETHAVQAPAQKYDRIRSHSILLAKLKKQLKIKMALRIGN